MRMRSRTIFADAQWRSLPWQFSQKSLRDLLIDILLEMPEVYRLFGELSREISLSRIMPLVVNIMDLCWRIDFQLKDWYDRFQTCVGGPVYWPKLSASGSPVDDIESGKVFPVAFDFSSYDVAGAMVLYWLALLMVHPILCHMYERLENLIGEGQKTMECSCFEDPIPETAHIAPSICLRRFTMDNLLPLSYQTEWARGPARNICQSAEYFMQEKMGELGPAIFLPRLISVREFLFYASGDWTRELTWIKNLVSKIQDMGNDILKYI